MNHLRKVTFTFLGLSFAGQAMAQDPTANDVKKPNILLIVDTSGSMEYKTGSDEYPTCAPLNPNDPLDLTPPNEKSRWIQVLEVLTGTIENYSCDQMNRNSPEFIAEFSMPGGGPPPPDANYRNPYHRPLSYGCAITPDRSTTLSNAFDWAAPLEADYPVNPSSLVACSPNFQQEGNGFIDIYNDQARFGLGTYDSLPEPDLGYSGAPDYTPAYPAGVRGAWSYYGTGSPAEGKPPDCLSLQDMEVGLRNGAAPASEGKMIYFGGQDLTDIQDMARHDRLQQVLLATRPFGATPINGALDDAKRFFWEDSSLEPTGSTLYDATRLSPRFDEYVECGCREQHIILITDGEPNLDLRPDCEAEGIGTGGGAGLDGVCPYEDTPAEILEELADGSTVQQACSPADTGVNRYQILTHVVGFSTDTYAGGTLQCAELRTNSVDWNVDGTGTCATNNGADPDLEVCCTLHQLAAAGSADGLGEPYLAPDSAGLQAALGDIMEAIVGGTASATQPVRSPGVGLTDNTGAVAFRILTSYRTDTGTSGVWGGEIERLRWTCNSGVPEEQPKDVGLGDDFVHNILTNIDDREFVAFVPTANANQSIRPSAPNSVNDGVSTLTPGSIVTEVGDSFIPLVPAAAMNITMGDAACTLDSEANDAEACAARVLGWTLGYNSGSSPNRNRCVSASDEDNCSVVGDVMHSTPTIVNRPTAAVEDESYETFANGPAKGRPMIALTSSNDGILHGFNLSPNSSGGEDVILASPNNEYFAFLPPAVLPQLKNQYPSTRMKLLDGVAIVQDVVATATPNTPPIYGYALERSLANAVELDAGVSTWRTIMVQGFGGEQTGYFALDITDPRRPSTVGDTGPQFLWQLTTTTTPANLFGLGGTPTIATVNIGGNEVAVAILPGGRGGSPTGVACQRNDPDASTWANTGWDDSLTGFTGRTYEPRTHVNCYSPANVAARSLTIVRLDTGEIVRTFRRTTTEVAGLSSIIFGAGDNPFLDSPITGIPAAFPAGPGTVSDRVFVGDQDGGLWRVDLSDPIPGNWTMELFFDAYAEDGDQEGKAITGAPVLSLDDRGQITILFATGDQDLSGGMNDRHYVYSLTEAEHPDPDEDGFYAKVNWELPLTGGKHVVGPLSLLAGVVYFTTVDPSQANACVSATSSIWGLDYIQPHRLPSEDEDSAPVHGGIARLSIAGTASQERSIGSLVPSGNEATVFGVSLEYVPSCTTIEEDALGALIPGSRTAVTQASSSNLQLVFQTNEPGNALGFETGFQAVTLDPPMTASSIRSWAAILD